MAKRFNKEKLKEFIFRRKVNFMSLLAITAFCILVTAICLITGFIPGRVHLLVIVSILLVGLCFLQAFRMRKSFRTIPSFKGSRKKKKREDA